MKNIEVKVKVLAHGAGLALPAYATEGSAGLDLRAAISEALTLKPGERRLVPTGLAFSIPQGFEAQVRPRSGLALKHGVTMLNTPGTIDSDYRGEVGVIMANLGQEDFIVQPGDRVAQMVFAPVVHAKWKQVEDLDKTERHAGGFGHTGKK
jgi:dUTP pyrophosphatase